MKCLHLISEREHRTKQSNLRHLAGSHIPFGGLLGTFHLLWSSALKIDRNKKRSCVDRPKIFFLVCRICDPQRECLGFTRQSRGREQSWGHLCPSTVTPVATCLSFLLFTMTLETQTWLATWLTFSSECTSHGRAHLFSYPGQVALDGVTSIFSDLWIKLIHR